MQDGAANKTQSGISSQGIFGQLRPLLASVRPDHFIDPAVLENRLRELEAGFAADCDRLGKLSGLLFGPNTAEYGQETANLFRQWARASGAPTMPAMAEAAAMAFGLDPATQEVKALYLSAILGEYPNGLEYHGNEHYRKVLFQIIRLVATHRQLTKDTGESLDGRQIALLLASACIHDLGHEGGDNMQDGIYRPGMQEQRAVDIASPYYEALGLQADDIATIETIVFCTDITFGAGDNSPCVRLKKIYKYWWWGDDIDISTMVMGKLRRFEDDPKLVLMGMLLHEADIATSAGLDYEQTVAETISITAERGIANAGPQMILVFLREQLGEGLFTQAGRQLFGGPMATIIARAEQDVAGGKTAF
jgi:hypothetical protein